MKTIILLLTIGIIQANAQTITYPAFTTSTVQSQKIHITPTGFVIIGNAGDNGYIIFTDSLGNIQSNKLLNDSSFATIDFANVTNVSPSGQNIQIGVSVSDKIARVSMNIPTGNMSGYRFGSPFGSLKLEGNAGDYLAEWLAIGTITGATFKHATVFAPFESSLSWGFNWTWGSGLNTDSKGLSITKSDTNWVAVCKLDTAVSNLGLVGFTYGPLMTTHWRKRYTVNVQSATIDSTFDDGYIVAGTTNNNAFLIKIDNVGNVLWKHAYSQTSEGIRALEVADGIFLLGNTTSFGQPSAFLLKTDLSGNFLWSRRIGDFTFAGDLTTRDGMIDIVGAFYTGSSYCPFFTMADANGSTCQDSTIPLTVQNLSIVNIGEQVYSGNLGNLTLTSLGMQTTIPSLSSQVVCTATGIEEIGDKFGGVYPNPFDDHIYIGCTSYRIFDMSGRIVTYGKSEGILNVSNLENGIYFVSINNRQPIKIIKTR
jgi:hypothetical protein